MLDGEGIITYLTGATKRKNKNNGDFIIPLCKDGLSHNAKMNTPIHR